MQDIGEGKQYQVSKGAGVLLLVILALLQLSDWADRSILSISLQAIKDSFHLTDAQAGMLPSLLQFGIAIFTIPAAMLADRFARRKVIMAMSLVWSVFTLATGMATQVWHMFMCRFLVGAGEAGYQPAGQTWLGVTFGKMIRSRVMAVFMMFNPLGIALGLFVGGYLLTATHDWRTAFFVFGTPGIILAFIVLFLPDYKAVQRPGEAFLSKVYFKGWGDLFKIKSYVIYIIGSTFLYFIAFAGPSWVPTLLMRTYNMEAASAGALIAGVSLIAFLAPIGGILADKWQKRNAVGRPLFAVIMIFLLLSGYLASMLTVGVVPMRLWLVIYTCTVLCSAFVMPSVLALPHDFIPVGIRSTAIGIQTLVAQLLGGMLGPVFVGAVSDALGGGAHGIQWGLIWTIPIAALSIVFMLIMTRYYRTDSAKISDAVLAEK
jgi:MFS family permease